MCHLPIFVNIHSSSKRSKKEDKGKKALLEPSGTPTVEVFFALEPSGIPAVEAPSVPIRIKIRPHAGSDRTSVSLEGPPAKTPGG